MQMSVNDICAGSDLGTNLTAEKLPTEADLERVDRPIFYSYL